jgi:hypothetical protein
MLSTRFELVINLKLNARLEVHDKLLTVAGAVMAIVASPLCHRNKSKAIRPLRIYATTESHQQVALGHRVVAITKV